MPLSKSSLSIVSPSKSGIDRVDQPARAWAIVADAVHLVAAIGKAELRVGLAEADRAAEAVVAEAPRDRPLVHRLGRVQQHTVRLVIGPVLLQLDLVVLLGDHVLERVAAEQAHAVHLADRRAINPRDSARDAVARAAG